MVRSSTWAGIGLAVSAATLLGACQQSVPAVTLETVWASGGTTGPLAVAGSRAYAMVGGRLMIADIAVPDPPKRLGESTTISDTLDIAIVGDRAYAVGEDGMSMVDVSAPAAPAPVGRTPLPGQEVLANGDDLVLLERGDRAGLAFLDLSQPDAPRVVDRYQDANAVLGMAQWRKGLLIAVQGVGVEWLDLTEPASVHERPPGAD